MWEKIFPVNSGLPFVSSLVPEQRCFFPGFFYFDKHLKVFVFLSISFLMVSRSWEGVINVSSNSEFIFGGKLFAAKIKKKKSIPAFKVGFSI